MSDIFRGHTRGGLCVAPGEAPEDGKVKNMEGNGNGNVEVEPGANGPIAEPSATPTPPTPKPQQLIIEIEQERDLNGRGNGYEFWRLVDPDGGSDYQWPDKLSGSEVISRIAPRGFLAANRHSRGVTRVPLPEGARMKEIVTRINRGEKQGSETSYYTLVFRVDSEGVWRGVWVEK